MFLTLYALSSGGIYPGRIFFSGRIVPLGRREEGIILVPLGDSSHKIPAAVVGPGAIAGRLGVEFSGPVGAMGGVTDILIVEHSPSRFAVVAACISGINVVGILVSFCIGL